jgi:hypothetical protein
LGIRLPLQTVLNYQEVNGNTPGASSVAGGTPLNFYVPQDSDNIVVKLVASVSGGGYSAFLQTTDDGGTTWYDVGRTSIVSNTAGNYNAVFLNAPVVGAQAVNTIVGGSILTIAGTSAAASTLSARSTSGLPILGTLNRVFLVSTGTITATSMLSVQVKVNSQTPNS